MPNWCSNRVTVSGPAETLTAFMLAAKVGDEALSFDNIYPCPPSLRDAPSGSDEIYYDIAYGDLSAIANYGWIPESIKGDRVALMAFVTNHHGCSAKKAQGIADLIKSNLETYGSKNWYDWCCRAWGTKWGTCNSTGGRSGDVLEYHFDTAWCPATEGFLEVSRLFPELVFQMEYLREVCVFVVRRFSRVARL